jgi:UDP-glucose 4-epimerase
MKALVTGGAGFIGSNLVDELLNQGHEVTVIDNESSDAHDYFYWNKNANNNKLNICDYEATRNLYDGVDYVFHLAAEARIQPAILNPIKAATTNFVGTCTVLQCAREAGVKRVMYSSTSSGYGLKNNPPLKETMPNDCLNPYSVSKTGGEELCKMYSNLFGLETVIFRYFNVYGERQPLKGQYAPVIGIFLRQKAAGEPMTIVGDGNQRRDFTHVKDVVSANILAAKHQAPEYTVTDGIIYNKWKWGQMYNVGTGINYSVNEIAQIIGGPTTNIPPRLGESRITLADNSKIKEHFGWNPTINLQNWLESVNK